MATFMDNWARPVAQNVVATVLCGVAGLVGVGLASMTPLIEALAPLSYMLVALTSVLIMLAVIGVYHWVRFQDHAAAKESRSLTENSEPNVSAAIEQARGRLDDVDSHLNALSRTAWEIKSATQRLAARDRLNILLSLEQRQSGITLPPPAADLAPTQRYGMQAYDINQSHRSGILGNIQDFSGILRQCGYSDEEVFKRIHQGEAAILGNASYCSLNEDEKELFRDGPDKQNWHIVSNQGEQLTHLIQEKIRATRKELEHTIVESPDALWETLP